MDSIKATVAISCYTKVTFEGVPKVYVNLWYSVYDIIKGE